MKKNLIYLLLAAAAVLFASCAKETYTLYDPANKVEGIQGSWTLRSVEIKDDASLIDLNTVDVSALTLGTTPMTINFEGSSFTVMPGTTQNLLGQTAGSWAFDNNLYPLYLNLTGGSSTSSLKLGAPTRPQDNTLIITFKGGCAGASSKYSYIFTFDRSN